MTRSGYIEADDEDYPNQIGLYRANLDRATASKRGQAFFRALVDALDALPEKKLVRGELETDEGSVCALGALRRAKGLELSESIRESEWDTLGEAFAVAPMVTQEVMFENDDDFGYHPKETDEQRWERMRKWAAEQIAPAADEGERKR